MPPPHTKEILSDMLLDFLLDWNMDRKISTITVDNCSSNDGMIGILREKLSLNNSLLLNGKVFHMRCAAHILNHYKKKEILVTEIFDRNFRHKIVTYL